MKKDTKAPRIRERVRPRPEEAVASDIRPPIPAHLDFLFNDRTLSPGENAEQYDALRDSIVQQVKPTDVVEALWTKDIIDFIWEAKRLRRWRRQILEQARRSAFVELTRPIFDYTNPHHVDGLTGPSIDTIGTGWSIGEAHLKKEGDRYLREQNLSPDDVTAQAFLLNLSSVERIDRLASLADQRRDSLLREIERKRTSFAHQLRTASAEILEVEQTEHR